jgi:hypothetical protein
MYKMTRGWGGMCIGLLFLVFIGSVVYLIVKSAKTIPTKVYFKENNSLEILKRCYAKGEVNEKEYHRMKKDLQEDKCEKEDYEIILRKFYIKIFVSIWYNCNNLSFLCFYKIFSLRVVFIGKR